MAENKSSVTRRGFLAGCGVVAIAAGLPTPAMAAPTWASAKSLSEALRAAYLAEVERLAMALRSRFESGELRGFRSGDDDGGGASPHWEVERLAAAWFGLEVARDEDGDSGSVTIDADARAAHLILAASPHAESTDCAGGGWNHVCYHAHSAAAWDVIALARERGWYVPTADESEDPSHLA
jgi:hypothetical protein